VAYRAEIQIGVKGVEELTKLQKRLEGTNFKIDEINKKQSTTFGGLAQSIQNYAQQLNLAEKALSKVAAATPQETRAVNNYVTALGNANAARERQNKLIEQEIANRTAATAALKAYNAAAAAPTQRGAATTMSGGYLRGAFRGGSQYPGPIGPGAASSTALSSALPARSARTTQYLSPIGPISPQERTGRAEQLAREAALKSQANQKEFAAQKAFQTKLFNIEKQFENSLIRQRVEADNAEFDRLLKRLDVEKSKRNEINTLTEKSNKKQLEDFDRRLRETGTLRGQTSPIGGAVGIPGSPAAKQRTARNKKLQGAASNAIIGGAFPLLFGQGVGASVGGAAGGALGGLAGGQFGFGLSLVGTAVGTAVDTLIAKAGDLGKALNPLTADIGALADAAGLAGTENGKLIKSLESFVGSEKALQLASQQLAVIVGEDGVQALKEYGDANTNLSNQLSKAFTDLSASIAPFLSQITGAIAQRVETTRLVKRGVNEFSADPAIKKAQDEFLRRKISEFELEQKIADVVRQKEAALQKAADSQLQATSGSRIGLQIAEQEFIIEQARGNLLDARVQKSEKEIILLKASEEAQAIISQEDKKQLTSAQAQLKFEELNVKTTTLKLQLENAITKAKEDQIKQLERENQAAKRAAAAEAKRAQRELEARTRGISSAKVGSIQALIAGSSAGLQSTRVFEGEKAFLDESEKALEYEVRLKTRILDIQYKQRASQAKSQEEAEQLFNTYNTQYDTIERIYFTQLQQIRQQKEQLRVQKEINALQQAEETAGITRGFTRNIADVERRIASPFGGDDSDMLNLRIEQLRRTEDVYRDIDTQVSILNKQLEADPSNEIIADNIKGLEERRQKLEALLPVLDQVEQAELRQNQLMEKYGFIANEAATAMSSAVQSIVTGTGSVEEAFSDMFANIGKAFIDMATQIIAKALVMKALNILGSAFGGGLGSVDAGAGTSNLFGNSISDFGGGSFGGFMANGGPVNANTPYIVGESGPELMIPSTSGMVLSNSETRQQLTQQGSAMRSTEATRQQLNTQRNTMITNSTRETERMTEMMLSNPDPIDVRYESTVINNVEYVTAEQHRQGMAQAAERGRSLTLSALQGSVKTRKKVGLS
jgi:hypothetical protein